MTVLYIAFGIVALWLLAEVLMQYKARLRWRLLAFAGFVGVVAGVVLPSVLVIAAGATAFALGQTLVTLSFRKGFVAGWALRRGGEPVRQQRSRRRRGGSAPRPDAGLEVTALEYGSQDERDDRNDPDDPDDRAARAAEADDRSDEVFTPGPVPEETGSYGIQSFVPQQPDGTASFASPFTTAEQDAHQYAAYYDPQGQGAYDYTGGYQTGEQQVYAAYSDPYIGMGGAVAPAPSYDYTSYTSYTSPSPYADQTQQQYSMDTPPGGVWVPQQRANDAHYPGPEEQQDPQQQPPDQGYPYQGGTGEYEQYRY